MSHIWQWCDREVALCAACNHQAYRQIIAQKHQSREFTEDLNIKVGVLLLSLGLYLFFSLGRFIRQFTALSREFWNGRKQRSKTPNWWSPDSDIVKTPTPKQWQKLRTVPSSVRHSMIYVHLSDVPLFQAYLVPLSQNLRGKKPCIWNSTHAC